MLRPADSGRKTASLSVREAERTRNEVFCGTRRGMIASLGSWTLLRSKLNLLVSWQ